MEKRFKKIMCNKISFGTYLEPWENRQGGEFLIIERLGEKGEFLLISDTNYNMECKNREIPSDIKHKNTMLCILLKELENEAYFLMVRRNDYGLEIPGKYYPVDGFAKISTKEDKIELMAGGRHIHSFPDGGDVPYYDVIGGGMSWIFEAKEV